MARPTGAGVEVVQMLAAGASGAAIREATGCSKSSVAYHRRKAGIAPMFENPRHNWGLIQCDYDDGMTLIDLIRKYGFTSTSWYRAIKKGRIRQISGRGKQDQINHGKRTVLQKKDFTDPVKNRERRYAQMDKEESQAQKLRDAGYEVYSPTVPCDRIAIKDGKVFFIEFKKHGQKLRVIQERLRSTVPEMYLIVFHD